MESFSTEVRVRLALLFCGRADRTRIPSHRRAQRQPRDRSLSRRRFTHQSFFFTYRRTRDIREWPRDVEVRTTRAKVNFYAKRTSC
nr:MAG: MC147R [Molluscum contagiosum virus]